MAFPALLPQSRFNLYSQHVVANLPAMNLRLHQRECLQALHAWFNPVNGAVPNIALVVLPTGSGKSGVAALAPYVLNATTVLVITPSAVITRQLFKDFCSPSVGETFYERIGFLPHNLQLRGNFLEPSTIAIYSTADIDRMHGRFLTIANAHKFGPTANVNMDNLPQNVDLVIVDEAHHYPAPTWSRIIDHFPNSRRLFLTATPFHNGGPILPNQDNHICFNRTMDELIAAGVIRPIVFTPVGNLHDNVEHQVDALGNAIVHQLNQHDGQDPTVQHQAMILTLTTLEADYVAQRINQLAQFQVAQAYHTGTGDLPLQNFNQGLFNILIVCGKLLEGYDNSRVSVVGIHRNVQPRSRVLFTQFVGRCVRKITVNDPVNAVVVSHVVFNQQQNFNNINALAQEDPEDD